MALDHDSGALDGLVLAGRHRDQLLSKLTLEQLLAVRADCIADDPQGVPLIEAYLDRIHGATWREKNPAVNHPMTRRRNVLRPS